MKENKQDNHALLSASGSSRWIGCPASVAMEYGLEDETSEYAAEGIAAHELAHKELNWFEQKRYYETYFKKQRIKTLRPSEITENKEMGGHIAKYAEYIENINLDKNLVFRTEFEVEVDFSNAVINGHGTADALLYNIEHNILHIIDFKYGFNKVEANNNTQMLLYAIGAINYIKEFFAHRNMFIQKSKRIEPYFTTITLHIVQPRINNFDTWTLTIEELNDWIKYFQVASIRALTLNDEFNPSAINCKYCKAKKHCPALTKFVEERSVDLKAQMDSGTLFQSTQLKKIELDNNYIKKILDNSSLIKDYLVLIENIAKERLIAGDDIPGYKAVQTMSCRKLNKDAEDELYNTYGDSIYQKKLLGIGELERVVGKKELDKYTHKIMSNIALAKDTDKRLSVSETLKFEDLTIKN